LREIAIHRSPHWRPFEEKRWKCRPPSAAATEVCHVITARAVGFRANAGMVIDQVFQQLAEQGAEQLLREVR